MAYNGLFRFRSVNFMWSYYVILSMCCRRILQNSGVTTANARWWWACCCDSRNTLKIACSCMDAWCSCIPRAKFKVYFSILLSGKEEIRNVPILGSLPSSWSSPEQAGLAKNSSRFYRQWLCESALCPSQQIPQQNKGGEELLFIIGCFTDNLHAPSCIEVPGTSMRACGNMQERVFAALKAFAFSDWFHLACITPFYIYCFYINCSVWNVLKCDVVTDHRNAANSHVLLTFFVRQ